MVEDFGQYAAPTSRTIPKHVPCFKLETAMIYKRMHSKDRRTNGQKTTDEEKGTSQHRLNYIIHPHLVTLRLA